jgi:hypothetical protein
MHGGTPAPLGGGGRGNIIDSGKRDYTTPGGRGIEIRRLPRRRWVERIYGLGCRVAIELIEDFLRSGLVVDEDALNRRLAQFAALDPVKLATTGGDRLPPVPVHLVSVVVARI